MEDYFLTDLNKDKMDIQVLFSQPKKVSQSSSDLDGLQITFKDAKMFKA